MKTPRTPPLGLPLALLFWFLLELTGNTSGLFFPDLTLVLTNLITSLSSLSLWVDLFATLRRALFGFFLSAIFGIPIGLIIGRSSALYRHVKFPVDFIRSIPAATLFPLFILIFGIGEISKIAVVFYGCVFIIIVSAIYGGRDHPDRNRRITALRSFRASQYAIYRWVIIPDALGNILAGLRIAASVALILVVITEMFLGGNEGLGKRIYDAYLAYDTPSMYADLIVLGTLGYVLNTSLERLERTYRMRVNGSA